MPIGCLSLVAFFALLVLLPFFLADVMLTALGKLGLSAQESLLVAFMIFFGGAINLPVKRIPRETTIEHVPFGFLGFDRLLKTRSARQYTLIAVNVGGCLVPCAVAVYELMRLMNFGPAGVTAAIIASGINIVICYKLARPIPKVGIALPALLPGFVAALCAIVLLPQMAPPVAFIAGVLGPLVGADLMHLKDIANLDTPVGSIGGAGTFDGIVISGIIAALLA
jgi:uncharacterized membrane protein